MLFAIIFLIVFGAIFLAVGIGIGKSNSNRQKRCTEKVSAVVVRNDIIVSRSGTDRARSKTYSPVFRYMYKDKEYTACTGYSSSPPKFFEGETTELYIDPLDPKKIFCPKDDTAKFLCVIFSAFGIAAFIASAIVFIIMKINA